MSDTTTPAPSNGDERRALRSLLEDWVTAFVDSIEGGEEDELVKATRAALADKPVAQEASGWVAQMQSAKADPNGRKVIWHRSKFVRTKHDAQMIVAQWREQMPSEVLEYTIAEVCTFAPGVRLAASHPSQGAEPAMYQIRRKKRFNGQMDEWREVTKNHWFELKHDLDNGHEAPGSWELRTLYAAPHPPVSADAGKGVPIGWVAQMQTKKDGYVAHRSRIVRGERDAQLIVGQWHSQMPSQFFDYVASPIYASPSESVAVSGEVSDLEAEAHAEGFDSLTDYVANLKQSASTYFAERNSARDAYRKHRDSGERLARAIDQGLRGAGYGRRFKLLEVCPTTGDEKDIRAGEILDAVLALAGSGKSRG